MKSAISTDLSFCVLLERPNGRGRQGELRQKDLELERLREELELAKVQSQDSQKLHSQLEMFKKRLEEPRSRFLTWMAYDGMFVLREGLKVRDLQDCMDDFIEKLDKSKSESWIEIWLVVLPLESCLICVCLFLSSIHDLHKTS